jgi:hypothetical protein
MGPPLADPTHPEFQPFVIDRNASSMEDAPAIAINCAGVVSLLILFILLVLHSKGYSKGWPSTSREYGA